jgi:lysozyme
MIRGRLLDSLIFEEGSVKDSAGRHVAYEDSVGVWTIGYGTNLQELKISEETALAWLGNHLEKIHYELAGRWPLYLDLDPVRRDTLLEMAYQMGVPNLLKFPKMLDALGREDWEVAAQHGLDSKWARETSPARAHRMMSRIRSGNWNDAGSVG